ncbi:MAG: hypothetical protein ACRD4S_00640 [Candidatus Acidiferrales bacterium]
MLLIASMILACPLITRAQAAPPTAIARIAGADVSVDNGAQNSNSSIGAAANAFVSNGGVVTVHSGQAQMTLLSGGQIDICGPAKLTLLQSAGSITLALDFGRLHAQLPPSTQFRVFTPTINATPLDIGGGPRDVTIGLYLNDSLCVRATSGALLLEQQFSGDKMVVPENGEFFLDSGKLAPVVGTPGSCQCASMQAAAGASASPPQAIVTQPPPPPAPLLAPQAAPTESQRLPPADYRGEILSRGNVTHPVSQAPRNVAPEAPAISSPDDSAHMPPLTFSASSPESPHDPTADIVLLVRTARVEPGWRFTGHVEPPEFAQALQQKLGESPSNPRNQPEASAPNSSLKKRGGFWAALKRVFTGGGASAGNNPCAGAGCD